MVRVSITKDESNILVAIGKLETQIERMSVDISSARSEIKEINTGISARLLNLESNSLSKIEVNPKLDEFEERISASEDKHNILEAKIGSYWNAAVIVGGVIVVILGILPFLVQLFFK